MKPEKVNAINAWLFEKKCRKTVENLCKRGFTSQYCATLSDARSFILEAAADAQSIGFGGSLTIALMNLKADLPGKTILDHGVPGFSDEERIVIRRSQLTCDLFLSSTNALTTDGKLVNIDGNGNRVAAMAFGPKRCIIAVGRNKLVEGGVQEALMRIGAEAAPPNAYRLGCQTPCATTGFCSDCDSPNRICRITTVIDRQPNFSDITVLVINEDLGL